MVRKSTTSTLIPSFFNSIAAPKACLIILPNDTMVTSLPSRLISATPIGIRYSPSGTSPLSAYICSLSIKITGSLSRIADFKSPFASYGVDGTMTFNPGQLAYQLSNDCECRELSIPAEPVAPRNTMGIGNCPPLMLFVLAVGLLLWFFCGVGGLLVFELLL